MEMKTCFKKRSLNVREIMIWLFLTIFLFTTFQAPIFAEVKSDSKDQFPSGITYKQLEKTIDDFVNDHKKTTVGVSVSFFDKNRVLLEKSYGYANVEDKIVNDAETVFEWGSATKLLVWISVMQLVEQGKLDLKEDIRTYLPEGFLRKLKYEDPITMIHLMNHNAGWQEIQVGLVVDDVNNIDRLGNTLRNLEPAQVFRPGEQTAYSNFGTALAGYVVEQISEEPFYDYVSANIFTPLEMTHTTLKPDLSDNTWVKSHRETLVCYTTKKQALGSLQYGIPLYPAGSATGTLSDFRKLGTALLPDEKGGSPLFDKADTLAELYTPTSWYPGKKVPRNCHGVWSEPSLKSNVIGHAGNTLGCSSRLLIDPTTGIGAVIMTNQTTESIYNYEMPWIIFGEKYSKGTNVSSGDADSLAGIYNPARAVHKGTLKYLNLLGNFLPVVKKQDNSLVTIGGTFECVEPGVYGIVGENGLIYMDIDANGQVDQLATSAFQDYVRTSWSITIFNIFLLLSLVIAGIYGLITLVIMLIRRIRKKMQLLGVWHGITCGALLAALLNLVAVLINISTAMASPMSLVIHGMLFILFALIPIVYTVILTLRMKQLDMTKKQKHQRITTAVFGLLMTFAVAFLQLWWFWV